jgi:TRAF-type zinc finger
MEAHHADACSDRLVQCQLVGCKDRVQAKVRPLLSLCSACITLLFCIACMYTFAYVPAFWPCSRVSTLLQMLCCCYGAVSDCVTAADSACVSLLRLPCLEPLQHLETHMAMQCRQRLVACVQGCLATVLSADVRKHESNDCSMRLVSCPKGCSKPVRYCEVQQHVTTLCARRHVLRKSKV